MAELIDKSKLMFLLEREMDMNGITDWGKGYMEAIHDAMEHVKFMETTTEAEIRAKAYDEFCTEAIKQFAEFDRLHGYPTVADCEDVLNDVAEQLKEE